jgi:dienelactone hydrolase
LVPSRLLAGAVLILCGAAGPAAAQINTDIVERHRADLQRQAADPAMKREGGTQPQDWNYTLPDGVTTRQVTFFVDGGTPLHGKIFYPKGFTREARHAAVAVGHGVNALSIGIEKYAARFAERGLVAMAIDYRTYGFSGSDLRLLEPDPGKDDDLFSIDRLYRVETKRTNLNNFREVEDFRAAVSFLQGEPGVDPDRIGLWGSSNGGAVVVMTAAVDARVKAVVSQVGAVAGIGAKGPVSMRPEHVEDAIQRARTGQGAEADGGFSFRSKIDLWGTIVNREFRPGAMLDRVPLSTRILWLPAEKDELIPLAGPLGAPKAFKGTSQAIVLPYITHFQAYSYTAFEVGSSLAADWFLKYLVADAPAAPAPPARPSGVHAVADPLERRLQTDGVSREGWIIDSRSIAPAPAPLPDGVSAREVNFYSELVQCHGKLYFPRDFSPDGSWPAVVVAPGWEQTAGSVDRAAADLAWRGIVAMAIDYRGWGRSGGFLYPTTTLRVDDRLRFSQHTTRLRIQRRRLIPEHQILDIRNAISWLQGEPGVDRARIGVWGTDRSAGHVIMVAATDARVAAGVAASPIIPGRDAPAIAFAAAGDMLRDQIGFARRTYGVLYYREREIESALALAQYLPFQWLDHVPRTTAILFVAPGGNEDAAAAAKRLAGPTRIAVDEKSVADWFLQHLAR